MISATMPTYNAAEYLAETIDSYLKQTYKNFELIVQDDGSTDSTDTIMAYFVKKDKRVKYFKNGKNLGIAKTRNNAFSHAKGEFIAIVDADDPAHPGRFKKSIKAIKDVDIVYSPCLNADADGKVFEITEVPSKITLELLRKDQQVPHPTIMCRRKCLEEHPWRNNFKSNDDLQLIFEWFIAGYKWKRINTPLIIHRHHSGSVTIVKRKQVAKYGEMAKRYLEREVKKL